MKMQDFMQKIKEKKLKRSDWLILVLAGILILIIALPTDTKEKKQAEKSKENISKENNTMEASKDEIERKLEDILEKIDGAGDVKVMITYQDSGTQVVERNSSYRKVRYKRMQMPEIHPLFLRSFFPKWREF